jgi:site-specific recombinase XerC
MEWNAVDIAKRYSQLGDVRVLSKGKREQKGAFGRHREAWEPAWRCQGSRRQRREINTGISVYTSERGSRLGDVVLEKGKNKEGSVFARHRQACESAWRCVGFPRGEKKTF